MKLINLFSKPCIISVIGDVNSAKSMTLYNIIEDLRKTKKFSLFTYGLRSDIENVTKIYSVEELEQIKDSLIIIDELMSLWDLDNRKIKKQIENTLRLIHHNNNILIISAVPENIKKFISSKINVIIYKKVTFEDFINGSSVKRNVLNYKGIERGSKVLNLPIDECLVYDGKHYTKVKIKYLKKYDSKKDNVPIFVPKSVPKNVEKKKSSEIVIVREKGIM